MDKFLNSILNNFWGILGVLVSTTGLLIAIFQLRKIATTTKTIDETYRKTIEDLKNSETLTNISTILQKIEIMKSKLDENKIDDLKHDLTIVAKLLVTLQSSLSSANNVLNFDALIKLCNDLEVKIITKQEKLDKMSLIDEYVAFTTLELQLTKVQSELKFNKK